MGLFSNFIETVKEKKQELDDKREFLKLVDEKSKPFRRAAYMEQMLKESISEGIAKAKLDAAARLPKEKPKESDFGIQGLSGLGSNSKVEMSDPWKFMNPQKSEVIKKKKSKSKSKKRRKKK